MACGDVCARCHGAAPVGAPCSLCGPGPMFPYTSDRADPAPVYLEASDLPTPSDLEMVHWRLRVGIKAGKDACEIERTLAARVRAAFRGARK